MCSKLLDHASWQINVVQTFLQLDRRFTLIVDTTGWGSRKQGGIKNFGFATVVVAQGIVYILISGDVIHIQSVPSIWPVHEQHPVFVSEVRR